MSALRIFAATAGVMASAKLTAAKAIHTTSAPASYASSSYVPAQPTATMYPGDGATSPPALYIDNCYPLDLLPVYTENATYLPFYLAPFNQTGYLVGYSINGLNSTTGSNITWTDGPTATTYPEGGWATTSIFVHSATTYSVPPGEDYPATSTFVVGSATTYPAGPVASTSIVGHSTTTYAVGPVASTSFIGGPVTQSAPAGASSGSVHTVTQSGGAPVTQSAPAGASSGPIFTVTHSGGSVATTTLANGTTVTIPAPGGNASAPVPSPIELPFPVPSNVSYPPSGYACFHLIETNTTGCISFCGVQSPGVWNGTNFVAPPGAAATVSARSSVAVAALVVAAVFGLVL